MKDRQHTTRVEPGTAVRLDKWPTLVEPEYKSKREYESLFERQLDKLRSLQDVLYAQNRYALLIIFQAMDAAGKDSAIKHVMSGVNPQGCQVFSFKHPSAEELEHDFLWRTSRCLPERGRIGIFNRSYYEEVLIVRVHPEILRAENLPEELAGEKDIWKGRYRSIVEFEDHLHRNGTEVVKFFLHVSWEEQRKRFIKRIDDPAKNWKFSEADLAERARWDDYMKAYEACLSATSAKHAPWHIIPADDKKTARLLISRAITGALEALKPEYPRLGPAQLQNLKQLRDRLRKQTR
jgi:PPK2 family polyphosphate:nucleotide phosphotransferase